MAELWTQRSAQAGLFNPASLKASASAKQFLTGLWVPQSGVTADLVGTNNMTGKADFGRYGFGANGFGTGIKGNGTAAASAKGIFGRPWNAGTNTVSGFCIVTFASLSGSDETIFLRDAGSGTGVSFAIFPSSRGIRALLNGVFWGSGSDRFDSSITVGVPWFIGFYYSPAEGFWVYSAPVRTAAYRVGTAIYTGSANVTAQTSNLYLCGAEYSGGATGVLDGIYHMVGLSNKPVPRQWFESISRDPWALFAPERRASYFFPTSGIPTLSAATAVSIGSTTATPRVTVTF